MSSDKCLTCHSGSVKVESLFVYYSTKSRDECTTKQWTYSPHIHTLFIYIYLKNSVKCVPNYITFWLGFWIKLARIKFQLFCFLFCVVSNHLCFPFYFLFHLLIPAVALPCSIFHSFSVFPLLSKPIFLSHILCCSSCRMFLFDLCLIVIYYYEGTCVTTPENKGNDFFSPRNTDKGLCPCLVWHTI